MAKVAIRIAESALDASEVGERLISDIIASIGALADQPDMGRVVPEFDQP